jgi:predicted methyltransferase
MSMSMKPFLMLAAAAGLFAAAPALAADKAPPAYVMAAVSAPDRPKADTDRDALRHPAELIAFAGIKPGQSVGDYVPGGGYFTRIFSAVVGPKGHVYALLPSELAARLPKARDTIQALAAQPGYANVSLIVAPNAETGAPAPLDVVWTSDNYHDVYGFYGPDAAAAADAAIFKALKPGGVFIVIDHAAPGAGGSVAKTLHRIDPETVKAQVLAAGFVLEAQSPVLADPADPHNVAVFDPSIRGRTDQFVFKFRKPRG